MRGRAIGAIVALLACVPLFGQILDAGTPQVTLEGSVQSRTGDDVQGMVTAKIAPTWHINSNKPLDTFSIPTTLKLDNADLVEAKFPPHEVKSFTFSAGSQLAVFEGTIQIPFTAKLKPNASTIKATLHYQSCNDKVCLPPKNADVEFAVAPSVTPTPPRTPAPSSSFTPLSAAPKNASLFSSNIGGTFAERGLPLTLLAIFVLGLALNLTPCVYPLIPITIGYFGSQSGGSRGHRVALSSVYVVGLAITYSALGVFSALSGKLFGSWLQLPAVLIFFALMMLVLASSMFGAFDITVPHFITDRSGGQAGLAGALVMGLLIGIVAAPCVGPFVISLIALVAQIGSPFLGFLMFFVLALGLGVPYLLLGIFSSSAVSLPRAGMWMVQVKKAMGFVLIAMAFYFLRPLIGDTWFRYGVAASLLIGAIFLFASRAQGARVLRLAIAILLLVAGAAFAIPKKHGSELSWDAYDEKALAAAAAAHKPVIIDFYADWCMPCKELDEKTFSDKSVASELDRFVRIKANLTDAENPKTIALAKQYSVLGMPTIVFVDSNGHELPSLRLAGFEEPAKFLSRAKQAK
ncbi:MAG TPA: cytochrome c biogenesis protein CcdA [Thermoanaerobaculia bacterium]|nr:cytochrome c biogenesis protein CcdA [Thermoanaerobaculia bacterium]